ncbi:MAG: flagellar basal body-associated FliL family protein [Dehalococcoidia bacterium]
MNKPIVLAAGGAVAGIAVAFAAFMFLFGGNEEAEAAQPTEPVNIAGKLGPHITLSDRVFNLLPEPGAPNYVKLQTVIEFETLDPRWDHVLHGCGKDHAAGPASSDLRTSVLLVSAAPGSARPAPAAAGGPAVDPCDAEQAALLSAFQHEISTGIQVIEDAVTTIVTGRTASEIATPEGKAALREEIKAAVDSLIGEPGVYRVLFLNFITQ